MPCSLPHNAYSSRCSENKIHYNPFPSPPPHIYISNRAAGLKTFKESRGFVHLAMNRLHGVLLVAAIFLLGGNLSMRMSLLWSLREERQSEVPFISHKGSPHLNVVHATSTSSPTVSPVPFSSSSFEDINGLIQFTNVCWEFEPGPKRLGANYGHLHYFTQEPSLTLQTAKQYYFWRMWPPNLVLNPNVSDFHWMREEYGYEEGDVLLPFLFSNAAHTVEDFLMPALQGMLKVSRGVIGMELEVFWTWLNGLHFGVIFR